MKIHGLTEKMKIVGYSEGGLGWGLLLDSARISAGQFEA
jgi:hypothetical protein